MKATKVTHHKEIRIRVDFPYNSLLALKLKQITDAKWSKTMGAWHIPYTKDAFKQLKELFPEVEYNTAGHVERGAPRLYNKMYRLLQKRRLLKFQLLNKTMRM